MHYTVQWHIDDVQSPEYNVSFPDSEKDSEKKYYEMNITTHCGEQPVQVNEGQKITLKVKLGPEYTGNDENEAHIYFGHEGYKE